MDTGGPCGCFPGRKEGVIPGAHEAHPYRLYLVARPARYGEGGVGGE